MAKLAWGDHSLSKVTNLDPMNRGLKHAIGAIFGYDGAGYKPRPDE